MLGPAIQSLGSQSTLWVRVPVFGADVASIERSPGVTVRPLGENGVPRAGRPLQAPPSANAVAGTVDLYFVLDISDRAYRIDQRVGVTLPMKGATSRGLSVPNSAIVRDVNGGEWAYAKTTPDTYVRQRIEVASTQGDRAILSRRLSNGEEVVAIYAINSIFYAIFGIKLFYAKISILSSYAI